MLCFLLLKIKLRKADEREMEMKRFKKILSFILVISLLFSVARFSVCVSAAEKTVAVINGTSVNVRDGASTKGTKVITQISYREVDVISVSGDWLKIKFTADGKNYEGYIYNDSDYVKLIKYDDSASSGQFTNFPESYRSALSVLHAKYPNWKFVADNVGYSFEDAVAGQASVALRKQVQTSQAVSLRSMGHGAYDWKLGSWIESNDGWVTASREIIAYYMDPRNFLNDTEIYMFLKQSYGDGNYTEAGLQKIVAGTFLDSSYSDSKDTAYGGSYKKVILEAGKQSGISPYIIASKIIQEQGTKGTGSLISGTYSGYEGYYNFFNFGASGANATAVITNGLARAKKENWNSRSASIIGGAKLLAANYVEKGQDTYYLQDYNVVINNLYHQYAQAVHDARSKGVAAGKYYKTLTDLDLVFKIPVFTSMPSTASPKPAENSKKNNYYFTDISASGLTPSFSMYQYTYDLAVDGDAAIKATVPTGASIVSSTDISLKKGINNVVLTVKSETGYTNDYKISVNAKKDCTLYVNKSATQSGGTSSGTTSSGTSSQPQRKLGDVNGDDKITISDLANVKLHLLGKYTLTDDNFTSADVDKNGKITVSDLANIKLHLLGKYTIKG